MNSCPNEETLACYIEDNLSEQEKRDIALHIVNCKRCSETIDIHNKLSNEPMDKEVSKDLTGWAKGLVEDK